MGNLVNFVPPDQPPTLFESFWDAQGQIKVRLVTSTWSMQPTVKMNDAIDALKYAQFR